MQEKLKSEGKCLFCGKMFSKAGINRHLAAHLNEKESVCRPGKSFLVMVETSKRRASTPYFLSLWMDGKTEMQILDRFLRDIWVECCDHKSEFRKQEDEKVKKGKDKMINNLMMQDKVEEAMRFIMMKYYSEKDEISIFNTANEVFQKGAILEYNFDYCHQFSFPTFLNITVVEEYSVKADSEIVLLSRNEPLVIECTDCEKMSATKICTAHSPYRWLCDECAGKHAKTCSAFNDHAERPVVNSPRVGKCKYFGGKIDTERDGVYQM